MDNLSFRAQSLDNQTPDEEVTERRDLAEKISEVSLNGTRVFSKGSHTAFLLGDKFLLKTPSDQLDDAGRIAPILCYGLVPSDPSESWADVVVNALVDFAKRIDRTISEKKKKVARRGVVAILDEKKNRRRRKMVRRAVGVLIVLVVLGIIYEIVFRK